MGFPESTSSSFQFQFDPGSFRDRHGRVFYEADSVYRTLSSEALDEWNSLAGTSFFPRFMTEKKIVETVLLPVEEAQKWIKDTGWVGVLRHERIPFVSYPYEWSFGMLKDAALLHLELMLSALEEKRILKDSSAFNYQWRGAEPVLIDVLSLKTLKPGETWVGYRQFCQMFLYPLMLQSHKNLPFQPLLRGNIDGILPEHCSRMMSFRDLFRSGVFTHVLLQSKLQQKYAGTDRSISSELSRAGFSADLIKTNATQLRSLVGKLEWNQKTSTWSEYERIHNYTEPDRRKKEAFVRRFAGYRRWSLVWDLGCNTGVFSRIASESSNYVVAMDADDLAVERLYQEMKKEGNRSILPLVVNLADSPGLGWRGRERKPIAERGSPDLVICLALLHHMVIGSNIPLEELLGWLSGLGCALIIEFVDRKDPMVEKLLRNKDDDYPGYSKENFERELSRGFASIQKEVLTSGTRTLYFAERTNQ